MIFTLKRNFLSIKLRATHATMHSVEKVCLKAWLYVACCFAGIARNWLRLKLRTLQQQTSSQTNMHTLDLQSNGISNLNDTHFQFPKVLNCIDLNKNKIAGIMNEETVTKTIQNTKGI